VTVGRSRRRTDPAQTLGVAFAAAVVVHVAVVGALSAAHCDATPAELAAALAAAETAAAAADAKVADALLPLESTCKGDAALAAASRHLACAAPWIADVAGCMADVNVRWRAEEAECTPSRELDAVQIVTLDAEDIERIDPEPMLELITAAEQLKFEQQQQQQLAQLEKKEQQRQQELARMQAQVVEVAKPSVEVAPDNARFLAEHDSKVEKQTVARGSRHEEMVARSHDEAIPAKAKATEDPGRAEPPPDRPPGTNPDAPDSPGKLSMRSPGAIKPSVETMQPKVLGRWDGLNGPVADGIQAKRGNGTVEQPQRDPDPTHGGGGGGGGTPPVPDLHPSKDVLERAIGGGSVDHLDDVDDGDETSLNAKRWVYASFFNRLKRSVAQNWEPAAVWRRHDPSGSVYGFKSRVTQLRVSLDGKGRLSGKPVVTQASGVDVLDDEAVRAFEAAGPFPNPPDGLVQDGVITFEFSFHFEIGSPRTSWRILRQM
jgi:TonB family protein